MTRLVQVHHSVEGYPLGATVRLPAAEAADLIARCLAVGITPVRLLHRYHNVNAGEVAGFPDEEARQLIEDELAELVHIPHPDPAETR